MSISLDALSVRSEIEEAAEHHDLDEVTAEKIAQLSDEEINAAINIAVDDEFWAAYDHARSVAIATLAQNLNANG